MSNSAGALPEESSAGAMPRTTASRVSARRAETSRSSLADCQSAGSGRVSCCHQEAGGDGALNKSLGDIHWLVQNVQQHGQSPACIAGVRVLRACLRALQEFHLPRIAAIYV